MNIIKVPKQKLLDMDLPYEGVIEESIVDRTRWSIIKEIIFEMDGKTWMTEYSEGATESQDESPWEYDDEITLTEVKREPVTIMKWVKVKK